MIRRSIISYNRYTYCIWGTVLILQVVDECKSVPRSFPFHAAVDVRKVPNYAKIEQPIDLGTMGERCAGQFEIMFTNIF